MGGQGSKGEAYAVPSNARQPSPGPVRKPDAPSSSTGARGAKRAAPSAPQPTGASGEQSDAAESLRGDDAQARKETESWDCDDLLTDAFRSEYLLRQSEKEFSSENVAFVLGAAKLLAMPQGAPEARELSEALCREHVVVGCMLEVNLPPPVRKELLAWFEDSKCPLPLPTWRDAMTNALRTVKFDVFPRFRQNDIALECAVLHLRRCLLDPKCAEAFASTSVWGERSLTDLQKTALEYFTAAAKYATSYTSLASGWPSESSVQEALSVFKAYHAYWADFGMDAKAVDDIRKRLPEAPPWLFRPTITPCLNVLADTYIEWLDSKHGREFCAAHIGKTRSLPVKPQGESGIKLDTSEDYLAGW